MVTAPRGREETDAGAAKQGACPRLTPHLGAAALLVLLAGCTAAGRGDAASDAASALLVHGWEEAAGGAGAWDRVDNLRYTLTTIWYDDGGGERRRRPRHVWVQKIPGGFQVRVERQEAEGRYVQVWDGERAWAALDGRPLPDSAAAVTEIPYVAGDLAYWIGLPWKLRDPGVSLASSSAAGGHASIVRVTFGEGVGLHDQDRFWYYFADPGSPFPSEVHYIEEGRSEADRQRVRLAGWHRAGGMVLIGERRILGADGVPERALLLEDVVLNPGVAPALFRP